MEQKLDVPERSLPENRIAEIKEIIEAFGVKLEIVKVDNVVEVVACRALRFVVKTGVEASQSVSNVLVIAGFARTFAALSFNFLLELLHCEKISTRPVDFDMAAPALRRLKLQNGSVSFDIIASYAAALEEIWIL
jgi:hypothetical protein